MSTEPTRLREMTIRYRASRSPEGAPVMVDRIVRGAVDAAPTLLALLEHEPNEVFVILCLSTKCRVIAYHEVSRGTLDATLVHPRLCWAEHKRGYVAAVVMWRRRLKVSGEPASRSTDAT